MLTSRRPKELCFVSVQIAQLLDKFRIARARYLGEFVNGVEFRRPGKPSGAASIAACAALWRSNGLRQRPVRCWTSVWLSFADPPRSRQCTVL